MRVSSALAAELVATAHELADVARVATLSHFRTRSLEAENKEVHRFDPVTAADRLSEQRMREVLGRRRPQDGILGEEYGTSTGSTGLTWVLDPIDGTRGYLSGTPTWGVLISVRDAEGVLYGLMDQPYIGERVEGRLRPARVRWPPRSSATSGRPACHGCTVGSPTRTSASSRLSARPAVCQASTAPPAAQGGSAYADASDAAGWDGTNLPGFAPGGGPRETKSWTACSNTPRMSVSLSEFAVP